MRVQIHRCDEMFANSAFSRVLVDHQQRIFGATAHGTRVDHFGAVQASAEMGARKNRDDLFVVQTNDALMFRIVLGHIYLTSIVILLMMMLIIRAEWFGVGVVVVVVMVSTVTSWRLILLLLVLLFFSHSFSCLSSTTFFVAVNERRINGAAADSALVRPLHSLLRLL